MIDVKVTPKRLLVAVDIMQDSALLELAVSLARHQCAQLSALFIEDINLYHLAGLPFATEVDRVTSAELKFDSDKIGAAADCRIKRIRQRLDDLAKQSELTVSLTVVRGRYLDEALAAAATADLLLLNKSRGGRSPSLEKYTGKRYVPPVWAVCDGSDASIRALRLAAEIAESNGSGLNVILQNRSENGVAELEQQAKASIAGARVVRHFFIQSSRNYDAILHYVLQRGCSLVVMRADEQDQVSSQSAASLFADRVGCPVLLVS